MKKILFVFGTRPEAIKMAPFIKKLQENPGHFQVIVCVTGQHRQMLDQVLDFFNIQADYDLKLMRSNQTLFEITASALMGLEPILLKEKPDLVFVQGDTTTAMTGALASYYTKTPVAHLEAGLRSFQKYSPFPEEGNRILAGHLADYHFAPTEKAYRHLQKEGIQDNIWLAGNTVIDALYLGLDIIVQTDEQQFHNFFQFTDFSKRIILVTGHRRESFGKPFEEICRSILYIAQNYPDVEFIYPVHLNPLVRKPVHSILQNHPRIHLIEPLDYPYLIWLLKKCHLVLTDSGGIQEEAPALGKPVLVMREVTERTEGIQAGNARLVGTQFENIVQGTASLLDNNSVYIQMSQAVNPYGDGTTSEQIKNILLNIYEQQSEPELLSVNYKEGNQ